MPKSLKIHRTPTMRRMPTYPHKLRLMKEEGKQYASCTELANYVRVDLIVVRKDIAMTGLAGHRRYGYRIDDLMEAIKRLVGWDRRLTATLIGAGALGSALLGYPDFRSYNLLVESVFDSDPQKIGREVHGHEIYDIATLQQRLAPSPPKIGIICVSNSAAQLVCNQLVALGVKSLWKLMNISNDRFIRTTDDYHVAAVQRIFKKMYEKGDIYKGAYKGKYCTPCESFWTESQLVDGKCPDCGREVKWAEEEAYFFRAISRDAIRR